MFDIGHSLREARERQGLGYPEIELGTKIRAKYIRALEEEDFDAIPGDAYTRGFLRTYAEYLGLDGEVYVDEYASRFLMSWRDEVPARRERPHRIRTRHRPIERRAVLVVLAGIAVVTALVFAAWRYGGSTSNSPGLGTQQKQKRSAPSRQLVLRNLELTQIVPVPDWLTVDRDALKGKVTHIPSRDEMQPIVNEQLIVELYSR